MRLDSFFFPGGFVFVFVVSETGEEPHRMQVSLPIPETIWPPRGWKKKAYLVKTKRRDLGSPISPSRHAQIRRDKW
jgi:hypothetical protein